ncbi:hypothetical protein GON09_003651 [Rhodococcus sp. B50]|nr:hypothetical protein [Rhodococcus sp. B50]
MCAFPAGDAHNLPFVLDELLRDYGPASTVGNSAAE